MKTFTNTGNPDSYDIVHMKGDKDKYTITANNGKLTYTSTGLDRTYIIDNVEEFGFKYSNGISNRFKWSNELTPFTKASCKEWLDNGSTVDGVYTIKPSDTTYNVYCDMTTDGGGWTLLSSFGNEAGGYFTSSDWGLLNETTPSPNSKYSILNKINSFQRDSKYEFRIQSKLIGNGAWYTWIASQTVSPLDWSQALEGAPGLVKISTDSGDWGNFYGWGLSSNGSSFIDGGCTTAVSNWYWNAASTQWGQGIPTACGATVDGYDLGAQGGGESNHNKFWVR